jgi:hypothetical protein
MDAFARLHEKQLAQLNIPEPLYQGLWEQLQHIYAVHHETGSLDVDRLCGTNTSLRSPIDLLSKSTATDSLSDASSNGSLVVIPHVCSWDILQNPSRGLWEALESLSTNCLQTIAQGLLEVWDETTDRSNLDQWSRLDLLNLIHDDRIWSRLILYRSGTRVRAALPAPPYYPQVVLTSATDATEADLSGPFPFQYIMKRPNAPTLVIDTSLAYCSPSYYSNYAASSDVSLSYLRLPTIDLVPLYTCPDPRTRALRMVALLGKQAPQLCHEQAQELYAEWVHDMHVRRQQVLEHNESSVNTSDTAEDPVQGHSNGIESEDQPDRVWKVYTDANDPMEMAHPEAGLTDPHFCLTTDLEEADIVYSFHSLYAPGPLRDFIQRRQSEGRPVLINQFPYEGAWVQKDHLAREVLNQHGLPRPSWSLETYDLDVHWSVLVGRVSLAHTQQEEEEKVADEYEGLPLWIVKPAHGTQSQGHVVTRSLAHIARLMDAGSPPRVVQRYVERPVTYHGRKVDCRCLVLLTGVSSSSSLQPRPILYMHRHVYFRIAHQRHAVSTPYDRINPESVLTATHLLDETTRSSSDPLNILPVDTTTIAKLEADYKDQGFDWQGRLLPMIQDMIRELFTGMVRGFPAIAKAQHSRALYGVDVMFERSEDDTTIVPKLTEVTFCPANNAICEAYERNEELYQSFINDIFNALYLNQLAESIIPL